MNSNEFALFYERHWKYVYKVCYTYMKTEAEAEDCTEDVFVKVFKGDFAFENEEHERKWLIITACNLCKDRLKSYSRKNTVSIDEIEEPEAPQVTDYREVQEAVRKLPEKYKQVVWMFYYDGYSTEEIAKVLERPPSTIRNQLSDARKLLKKTLGGIL